MNLFSSILSDANGQPLRRVKLTNAGIYTPAVAGGSWHNVLLVGGGRAGLNGNTTNPGNGGNSATSTLVRIYLMGPVNYVCGVGGASNGAYGTQSIFGNLSSGGSYVSPIFINSQLSSAASGDAGGSGANHPLIEAFGTDGIGGAGATPSTAAQAGGLGAGGGGGAKGTYYTAGGPGGNGVIYIEEYGA